MIPFAGLIGSKIADPGHAVFTVPGTHKWRCPSGVYSICGVVVGGACFGGGGGLGWKNDIPVVPGVEYDLQVGFGLLAGDSVHSLADADSFFSSRSLLAAIARGNRQGGGFVGDSGGDGGGSASTSSGGGGAGGYNGPGGNGGNSFGGDAQSGSGGGGGGSGSGSGYITGGGGVGIFGIGVSGSGSRSTASSAFLDAAKGGSGGGDSYGTNAKSGGLYGGSAAPGEFYGNDKGITSAGGAVRILWGKGRAFPASNVSSASK